MAYVPFVFCLLRNPFIPFGKDVVTVSVKKCLLTVILNNRFKVFFSVVDKGLVERLRNINQNEFWGIKMERMENNCSIRNVDLLLSSIIIKHVEYNVWHFETCRITKNARFYHSLFMLIKTHDWWYIVMKKIFYFNCKIKKCFNFDYETIIASYKLKAIWIFRNFCGKNEKRQSNKNIII